MNVKVGGGTRKGFNYIAATAGYLVIPIFHTFSFPSLKDGIKLEINQSEKERKGEKSFR